MEYRACYAVLVFLYFDVVSIAISIVLITMIIIVMIITALHYHDRHQLCYQLLRRHQYGHHHHH